MDDSQFRATGKKLLKFFETVEQTEGELNEAQKDMREFIWEANRRRFWDDVEEVHKKFRYCMTDGFRCDDCDYCKEDADECRDRLLRDIWDVWSELIRRVKEKRLQ